MRAISRDKAPVKGPSASFALKASNLLWESLDTPVSLACWLMAKYGEWDQLVEHSVDPWKYNDATDFLVDYQSVSVLKKADFLQTTYDRRETARRTFRAAEAACRETNERLWAYLEGRLSPCNREVHLALQRAIRIIHGALGRRPTGALESRFGPGATSLVSRLVCVAEKYRRRVDVTPGLFPYLLDVMGPRWVREVEEVSLNASNRVSFVPKNAKTFRAIAIEPHINGYAQLGIAEKIRARMLRKFGIDLSKQGDVNAQLASIAQAYGLATIDLSSASDTVSRALVWLLLPEGWVQVLDSCRSHYGVLDGVEFEYEKFSSMGNGSTFELETLIFYALARACGGSRLWTATFGDDIIVESAVAPLLTEVLSFCGFTVNKEKSFVDGPFRESCGSDYHNGVEVRPFFWKDLDVPTWFQVCNDLRSLSHRLRTQRPEVSARLHRAWLDTRRVLPRRLDVAVPSEFGAVGVHDDVAYVKPNQALTQVARRDGWGGFYFDGWIFEPFEVPVHANQGAFLHCLDGGGYEGLGISTFRGIGKWTKKPIYAL